MNVVCANCDKPMPGVTRGAAFVLSEHLCAECQNSVTNLRLLLVRDLPTDPWVLAHAQPLRTSFGSPPPGEKE